jgi:hypothetical protein
MRMERKRRVRRLRKGRAGTRIRSRARKTLRFAGKAGMTSTAWKWLRRVTPPA